MDMTTEAINKIIGLHEAAAKNPDTDVPTVALPDGVSIHSLEKYMDHPARFRATVKTKRMASFQEYMRTVDSGVCFIDIDKWQAECVFDIGTTVTPGHCEHRATLVLDQTTEMREVERVNGDKDPRGVPIVFSQRELAEWLEDWGYTLSVESSDGEDVGLALACASVRGMTIEAMRRSEHEVHDFGESKSVMDKIDAKAKDKIPAKIHFRAKPFHGLTERCFTFRVAVLTGDDKPKFRLRCINEQQMMDFAADEFVEKVRDMVYGSNITVVEGSFAQG